MTPLAHELLEDAHSGARIHIRPTHSMPDIPTTAKLLWLLVHECKFFECTAVWPLAHYLAKQMFDSFQSRDRIDQRLAFLPAEKSWIETEQPSIRDQLPEELRGNRANKLMVLDDYVVREKSPYNYRSALVLLGQGDCTHLANMYRVSFETPRRLPGPRIWRVYKLTPLPLVHSGLQPQRQREHEYYDGDVHMFDEPVASVENFIAYGHLALINSPRIVGQQLHYPHQRLEREKLKKLKLIGKFPLRAWTEILLRVTPRPEDRSADESIESHLTGERCLHYCRTYLRIRLGMLEYVEGHWRGNPALGMKRSRYRLEKEKAV